jgi:hypothetical protein
MDGACKRGNELSGFYRILGNSWAAERLAASQEGLSSMELMSELVVIVTHNDLKICNIAVLSHELLLVNHFLTLHPCRPSHLIDHATGLQWSVAYTFLAKWRTARHVYDARCCTHHSLFQHLENVQMFIFSFVWRVPRALSTGVKRQWREADHSPPTSSEVKKIWVYTSTTSYAFMA